MAVTVWKGQLTFGLVSVPVRLYRAARKERVRLHYVRQAAPETADEEFPELEAPYSAPAERPQTPAASRTPEGVLGRDAAPVASPHETAPLPPVARVKQNLFSAADERPAPPRELLKGYEYAPEQYVVFQQEELRQLRPKTSAEMQIVRSVRLSEIDPVYFETSYYVVPDRGGERAYMLLFASLQKTQYVALAKVAMQGREHVVVIRPGRHGLLAHTMYYSDEVRAENEFQTSTGDTAPKEVELASKFIEAIAGPFAPEEFTDTYREQVQALISGKIERREVAASPAPTPPITAPVVDILEALKKSLELARKPVKAASQASRRPPGKVTEIKNKPQRRKA
jgi:DNA end-binding protein Ku